MTAGDFHWSLSRAVERAGIVDLTFQDLRTEASWRFVDAGLTKAEHGLMTGSADSDSPHVDLKIIQDKLDRYSLGGLTADEAHGKIPLMDPAEIIAVQKLLATWGALKEEKPGPNVIPHFPSVITAVRLRLEMNRNLLISMA